MTTIAGGIVVPEYPDTAWAGRPRWYSTGRDGKAPRLSVVHYTAGSESRSSAENGAAYDKIRASQVSCHVFHDPDSSVQELPRAFRAWAAYSKGNRLGIHHELCGTAQTRAQWLDDASDAILWRAARAVAKDCVDYNLQPRRLTVAEVRATWYGYPHAPGGICGHVDITRAFPEDGGDHDDPGRDFPWDVFEARVQQHYAALTGVRPAATTSRARNKPVIMYYCTSNDKPGGQGGTPTWAVAGMSPGTPANWIETADQSEANAYAARFGDALFRTRDAYAGLRAKFLAPLAVNTTVSAA